MGSLDKAAEAYNLAVETRDAAFDALENAEEGADLSVLTDAFDEAQAEVERCKAEHAEIEKRHKAREATPVVTVTLGSDGSRTASSNMAANPVYPEPRGQRTEYVYKPTTGPGYLSDFARANLHGDSIARERLTASARQSIASNLPVFTYRDLTTVATDGGGFVPPLYMGELWAAKEAQGRPFANAIGSRPLPAQGMSITLPKVTTRPTVAVQATENTALDETELVEATVTTPVVTIGGIEDASVQLVERSDPAIEMVIWDALRDDYDSKLDTQLLTGAGSSGEHRGIKNVSGTNAVTYSDFASPTAAELVPKLYDAIQKVASNRYMNADAIVMHPRRAAWLASNLSSTFPLFQLGSLNQASGVQSQGFVNGFAGLEVIIDPNVSTTYGTPTATEDTIFVVRKADLMLFEDGLRLEVFRETLSAEATVRFRLYAFSAFISARYPTAIAEITGQGLVTPSF